MSAIRRIIAILFVIGIAALALLVMRFWEQRPIVPAGSCPYCNVIVISIGPLRAQSLPCYGFPEDSAPALCAFGNRSLLFTHAYATASRTEDALYSVMTGLYPSSHHMNVPFESVLSPAIPTLPEVFKKHGYGTYFLGPVQDPHVGLSAGFGRGFDGVYNANDPASWIETLKQIRQKDATAKPFFAFLHSYAVHEPYIPDPRDVMRFYNKPAPVTISYEKICAFTYAKLKSLHPERFSALAATGDSCADLREYQARFTDSKNSFDETYAMTNDAYWHMFDGLSPEVKASYVHALYLASIYEFDRQFRLFLSYAEGSGLFEHTIVVVTGDHGDAFGEHETYSHGETLFTEVIHIPLIMSVPHVSARRIGKLTSAVDLMPTILSLTGISPPRNISGIDVLSYRRHGLVVAELVTSNVRAVITNAYALLVRHLRGADMGSLFHLQSDPLEESDVYARFPGIVAVLNRWYQNERSKFPVYVPFTSPLPPWLNKEDRKRLIQTGYF